jgi:hypothetical protein
LRAPGRWTTLLSPLGDILFILSEKKNYLIESFSTEIQ